ncbi:MAG: NYN domain-containing protein [Candidatus Sungbacteria bacterium]|nr:NYN domain-containing protein [Candidatus Sungbacteria bacterium]
MAEDQKVRQPRQDRAPSHRIAVFIDGQNLENTIREDFPGKRMDWTRLTALLRKWGNLVGIYIYLVDLADSDDPEKQKKIEAYRRWLRWLRRNGFRVRTKLIKYIETLEGRKGKCNFDVEMAVDAITLAATGRIDEIFLFSSDSDFAYLAEQLQNYAVRVTVVGSTHRTATELRERCDEFIPLGSLKLEVLIDWLPSRARDTSDAMHEDPLVLTPPPAD